MRWPQEQSTPFSLSESSLLSRALGTQFPCFTSTKVRILTPEELAGYTQPAREQMLCLLALPVQKVQILTQELRRRLQGANTSADAQSRGATQLTCFTGTSVRILTQKALQATGRPQESRCSEWRRELSRWQRERAETYPRNTMPPSASVTARRSGSRTRRAAARATRLLR